MVLIIFYSFRICFEEQNDTSLTVSPVLIVYKKLDFPGNISGVTLAYIRLKTDVLKIA